MKGGALGRSIVLALLFTTGAALGDDGEDDPIDVTVRGDRAPAGASTPSETLSAAEARTLPGAFGDPFRAIESMPGMAPVLSGLPYFYVRGAPPGNVGYYFDGVRVPYLFHFALGPGVVAPGLIAKTEIHRGGYPASLGRYAGGVVEATAMPPSDRLHGEGQARIFDAGALVETPFADGRGSVLVSGRYSYTAAIFSLVDSDTSVDYRDYQARVTYALTDRDTVSLLTFGAYDYAAQKQTVDPRTLPVAAAQGLTAPYDVTRVLFASEFHRVDARWDHTLPNAGHFRIASTFGYDRTRLDVHRGASDFMGGFRAELEQPVTRTLLFRAGADVTVDRYSADNLPLYSDDDDVVARQSALFARRTDFVSGVRADVVFTGVPGLEVIPGVRYDAFGSGAKHTSVVDPRLAMRLAVNDRVRLVSSYGVASQAPSSPISLPAISIARLAGGLQRAVQTSATIEADLPEDFTASLGGFHNAFYKLNDSLGVAQFELTDIEKTPSLLEKSRGTAFGLEVGLRRKLTRRVAGSLSYTLSRSERTADGVKFVSSYDRPHVLNAAVTVDLGRNWRAGARFVAYSGIPVKAPTPAYPEQVVGTPPGRTPAFYRLDLRLEKRWNIGERSWISFVVEGLNTTAGREVNGYNCGLGLALPGQPRPTPGCSARRIGPVTVPSIGVEGGF